MKMISRSGSSKPNSFVFISSARGTFVVSSPWSSISYSCALANSLRNKVHNRLCTETKDAAQNRIGDMLLGIRIPCEEGQRRKRNADHRQEWKNHTREFIFNPVETP